MSLQSNCDQQHQLRHQNNTDLLFRRILSAGRPLDVFDELLTMALTCLSHVTLLSGYDEPEILSYQIILFGPISADGRQEPL
jgi:hypothetical protein